MTAPPRVESFQKDSGFSGKPLKSHQNARLYRSTSKIAMEKL